MRLRMDFHLVLRIPLTNTMKMHLFISIETFRSRLAP